MVSLFRDKRAVERWKRTAEPRGEFLEETKTVFLAAYRERFPRAPQPIFRFRRAVRVVLAAFALFAFTGGVAVYADTANVTPKNPLYPVKRRYEFVQAALTSDKDQPKLHLKFAERRLDEVESFGAAPSAADTKTVAALQQELHEEMKVSLVKAEVNERMEGKGAYCGSLLDLMQSPSPTMELLLNTYSKLLDRFQGQCTKFVGRDENGNE